MTGWPGAVEGRKMSSETRRGFAFNHGDGVIANRRLKQRGVGSTEWDLFTS